MGLFGRLFKSERNKNKRQELSYISEIADLITGGSSGFMEGLNDLPAKNCGEDRASECWTDMDEWLEEEGYLISVDYKCELEDFLWALSQINNYSLIESTVSGLALDESQTPKEWGREINLALNGKAFVCAVDIDSDSYELIIVHADVYEKISSIAKANGHSIEYL